MGSLARAHIEQRRCLIGGVAAPSMGVHRARVRVARRRVAQCRRARARGRRGEKTTAAALALGTSRSGWRALRRRHGSAVGDGEGARRRRLAAGGLATYRPRSFRGACAKKPRKSGKQTVKCRARARGVSGRQCARRFCSAGRSRGRGGQRTQHYDIAHARDEGVEGGRVRRDGCRRRAHARARARAAKTTAPKPPPTPQICGGQRAQRRGARAP